MEEREKMREMCCCMFVVLMCAAAVWIYRALIG